MRPRAVICVVTDHRWHIDHDATHYEAVIICWRCSRRHPTSSETAIGQRIAANALTEPARDHRVTGPS